MPSDDVRKLNPKLYGRRPAKRRVKATPQLPAPTANQLNAAAITAIHVAGGKAWRNNVGGMVVPYTNKAGITKRRYVSFGEKGSADVLGVLQGRAIAIETKTPSDRLSPEQDAWLESFERAGGIVVIAQTIDDILSAIRLNFENIKL